MMQRRQILPLLAVVLVLAASGCVQPTDPQGEAYDTRKHDVLDEGLGDGIEVVAICSDNIICYRDEQGFGSGLWCTRLHPSEGLYQKYCEG